jgi:hypothetical protein
MVTDRELNTNSNILKAIVLSFCFLIVTACVSESSEQHQINSFSLMLTRRDGMSIVNDNTLGDSIQNNKNVYVEVYKFFVHRNGRMDVAFGAGRFYTKKIEFVTAYTIDHVQLKNEDVDSLLRWVNEIKKLGNYITKSRYNDSWSIQLNAGSVQRNYYDAEFANYSGATTHERDITRLLVKKSPIKVRYYPN